MNGADVQQLLSEAELARERARRVLETLLLDTGVDPDSDALHRATGRSATDRAVAATRQILETLDRSIGELKRCASAESANLRVKTTDARSIEAIR